MKWVHGDFPEIAVYKGSTNGGASISFSVSEVANSLFFLPESVTDDCMGYWTASPDTGKTTGGDKSRAYAVFKSGSAGAWAMICRKVTSYTFAVRPVCKIPAELLIKEADGGWRID